jgi:hypothetical protein
LQTCQGLQELDEEKKEYQAGKPIRIKTSSSSFCLIWDPVDEEDEEDEEVKYSER